MKALIKKLIAYDKLYPAIQSSAFYHIFKKAQAQFAAYLHGNPAKNFFIIAEHSSANIPAHISGWWFSPGQDVILKRDSHPPAFLSVLP